MMTLLMIKDYGLRLKAETGPELKKQHQNVEMHQTKPTDEHQPTNTGEKHRGRKITVEMGSEVVRATEF